MEDHDLHQPSTQEFELLSQNIALTTKLSGIYIFIYVFSNHVTVQERF